MTRVSTVLLAVLISAAPALLAQHAGEGAQVGQQVPDFDIGNVIMNDDGRRRMAQYFGRPLLVEFWGTQ